MDFLAEAKTLFEYSRGPRRHFYCYPQLGHHETRTASVIAPELNSFGLAVATGITGTGAAGSLEGEQPGPVLIAAHIINLLQSIASRNVSPLETAAVSVTCVHADDAGNLIPLLICPILLHVSYRLFLL
jgi:metal-dependent amidase/aminoacylase/carboxypeptidase family protein